MARTNFTTADFTYNKINKTFISNAGVSLPDSNYIVIKSVKTENNKLFSCKDTVHGSLVYECDGIKVLFPFLIKVSMDFTSETIRGLAGEPKEIVKYYIDGQETHRPRFVAGCSSSKLIALEKYEEEISERNSINALNWVV